MVIPFIIEMGGRHRASVMRMPSEQCKRSEHAVPIRLAAE